MSVGTAIIALILVSVQGNSDSLTCKTDGFMCNHDIGGHKLLTYLNCTELRWQRP